MEHAGPELLQAQLGRKKGDVQVSAARASNWPIRYGKNDRQLSVLYATQKRMLQLMADGLTMKEIAHVLGISLGTTKTYSAQMYAALRAVGFHAVDKASAVALGIRQGWIK